MKTISAEQSYLSLPPALQLRRLGILLGALVVLPLPTWAATGTHGMVAADHQLASQAGVEMLQHGGNAIDAAVATSFAVGVVNPASCGIGGGGLMLIYLARTHTAVALDYRETAPARASRDMFVRDGKAVAELSRRGGLAIATPGEVAGLATVLRRYGKLPLKDVMQPAIRYARDGFPVAPHLAEEIAMSRDALAGQPVLARNFLRPDGSPLQAGEMVRQPELAQTLEHIADEGPAAFYSGVVAERIVAGVADAGGVMSPTDLSGFRPTWRRPLRGQHRRNTVFAMPPPSSGGGVILEILGILGGDDLPALGHDSPTFLHLLAQGMQHAFADRAHFYGDTDFVSVPLPRLLSPTNLAALRGRISATRTLDASAYGSSVGDAATLTDHGTSHLSVMDAEGNAVACTTTINTAFGSMVVAGDTGIILNNEMDDFSAQPGVPNVYGLVGAEANAVAPGKRPLSSMSPTIVIRGGRPLLAVGGSGGPLIVSATLQVLLNVVDFDLDATAAVAAPRIHDQWMPPVLAIEPAYPTSTRAALAGYGYTVKEVPAMGAVQAVRRTTDGFEGAADPRKGGEAAGW